MQTKGQKIINAIGKENKRPYNFGDIMQASHAARQAGTFTANDVADLLRWAYMVAIDSSGNREAIENMRREYERSVDEIRKKALEDITEANRRADDEYERARDFTKDPTFDRRDTHAPAWFKEVSEALERMARENGALLSARRRESTGTGLKIAKNGLYVRQEDGTFKLHGIYYSKDGRHDGRECVTLFARNYSHIPAGFALDVVNDSDSMTDYFEDDRATVYPDHPLYKVFRAAADGAKPYTLTEKDVETLKAYTDAKDRADEFEEDAEYYRELEKNTPAAIWDAIICKDWNEAMFYDVERIAEDIETCGRAGNFCGRLAI